MLKVNVRSIFGVIINECDDNFYEMSAEIKIEKSMFSFA